MLMPWSRAQVAQSRRTPRPVIVFNARPVYRGISSCSGGNLLFAFLLFHPFHVDLPWTPSFAVGLVPEISSCVTPL